MNFDKREQNGRELLSFLMSDIGSTPVAPINFTSADLHACRLLLQRNLERSRDEAYRQGFGAGVGAERAARLEKQTAHPPRPFSPLGKTVEGTKTLLGNIGSTILVSFILQFFIPFLEDWATVLVVVEVVRGAIKVGGDFAFTASLSRSAKERVSLRAQLQFSAMYAVALSAQAAGTSIITQILSSLILQFARELPIRLDIVWYDVVAAGVLTFFSGCVAIYTQGFCIVSWVRNSIAKHKQDVYLTIFRSYARMLTNFLLLLSLTLLYAKLTR